MLMFTIFKTVTSFTYIYIASVEEPPGCVGKDSSCPRTCRKSPKLAARAVTICYGPIKAAQYELSSFKNDSTRCFHVPEPPASLFSGPLGLGTSFHKHENT